MATGKTVGKYARIHVDGYDLSGDANTVSVKAEAKKANVSALSSSTEENLFGIVKVTGKAKMWFDNAAAGSYTLLKTATVRVISIAPGIRAVPAVGDPVIAGKWQSMVDSWPIAHSEALAMNMDFDSSEPADAIVAGGPFGVLLHADGAEASSFNAASVDNGAATAAGGTAYLHVTAAGGTWALKVQHSSDNSSWSDLATFTANGTAITAEAKNATGTVNRYLRAVGTRTSGNFTGEISFVRG